MRKSPSLPQGSFKLLVCLLSIFILNMKTISAIHHDKRHKGVQQLSANNFLYQLDNLDLMAIGNTSFDLVIMDYSSDGEESGEFTAAQIHNLKQSPGGEKIVIAYMSIGEAEDYRFYWQNSWSPGNPTWLDQENPDWDGNYKVHYWDPAWQAIIFDYTDRILAMGFDGVYLDIIDAYEYYEERGRSTAAQEMVNFVAAINAHARAVDADFFIFPQNAPELGTQIPDYLNYVDGIGQEDIYYGYDGDGIATPTAVTEKLETDLNVFRDHGKLVLTVDYPFANSENFPHFDPITVIKINDAYSRSIANGYIPYCTVRNLNYLNINPGHYPSAVSSKDATPTVDEFELFQNYPNPFNSETNIAFHIPEPGVVEIIIFNIRGEKIFTLIDDFLPAGFHRIKWDGTDNSAKVVASGVYVCQLKSEKLVLSQKMILLP